MVGRGEGRDGVTLPAEYPVDITGDPHVVVVTVWVVNVADPDAAGNDGGVVRSMTPAHTPQMEGGVAGVTWGGGVPRCGVGVLAKPLAPPEACSVSAALRFRTAVPAGDVIAGRAPWVVLPDVGGPRGTPLANVRARGPVCDAHFSAGTLDARVRLLV